MKEEAWRQKRENFDVCTVVKVLFFASLKFKSENTVNLLNLIWKKKNWKQSFADVL